LRAKEFVCYPAIVLLSSPDGLVHVFSGLYPDDVTGIILVGAIQEDQYPLLSPSPQIFLLEDQVGSVACAALRSKHEASNAQVCDKKGRSCQELATREQLRVDCAPRHWVASLDKFVSARNKSELLTTLATSLSLNSPLPIAPME
jgi:hypothetical protein